MGAYGGAMHTHTSKLKIIKITLSTGGNISLILMRKLQQIKKFKRD